MHHISLAKVSHMILTNPKQGRLTLLPCVLKEDKWQIPE